MKLIKWILVIPVVDWYVLCLLEVWELDRGRADMTQLQGPASALKRRVQGFKKMLKAGAGV